MSDSTFLRAKQLRQHETKAESLLWELLRGRQLCGLKFRRQHPVNPYFADFACISKRLIVELDGGYHDQTIVKDLQRQKHLELNGWKVLRFANEDVLQEAVTRAIATELRIEYRFKRRPKHGSGMMSEMSPTRSQDSRPSQREG